MKQIIILTKKRITTLILLSIFVFIHTAQSYGSRATMPAKVAVIKRVGLTDVCSKLGYKADLVEPSVFSDSVKASVYKVILSTQQTFSINEYKNIMKYVENGGVFVNIGWTAAEWIDKNNDDIRDDYIVFKFKDFYKVTGSRPNGIKALGEINFSGNDPVLKGIDKDNPYKIKRGGGLMLNLSGTFDVETGRTLASASFYERATTKDGTKLSIADPSRPLPNMPCLVVNNYGKGKFYSFGFKLDQSAINAKDPSSLTIMKNLLSLSGKPNIKNINSTILSDFESSEIEARGFYYDPKYYGLSNNHIKAKKEIKHLISALSDNNFNFVAVLVKEYMYREPYYTSQILSPPKYSLDILKEVINESKKYGLEVHLWIFPDWYYDVFTEKYGNELKNMDIDKRDKKFADFFSSILEELLNQYQVDGVFYDDEIVPHGISKNWRRFYNKFYIKSIQEYPDIVFSAYYNLNLDKVYDGNFPGSNGIDIESPNFTYNRTSKSEYKFMYSKYANSRNIVLKNSTKKRHHYVTLHYYSDGGGMDNPEELIERYLWAKRLGNADGLVVFSGLREGYLEQINSVWPVLKNTIFNKKATLPHSTHKSSH
jgi:hypothetical protein